MAKQIDQMTAYELARYIIDNEPSLADYQMLKLSHDLCLKVILEEEMSYFDPAEMVDEVVQNAIIRKRDD